MNVVHLQLSGGIGGISILTKDIALISKHNNIFYFLYEGGEIAKQIEANGSKVFVANEKHSAYLGSLKRFVKFCKDNKADVIICHAGAPITRIMLAYCKRHLKNVRCLLYLHSNAADSVYPNKLKQIIHKRALRLAHRASDYSVAISRSVKNSYVDLYGFNPNKVKVVYNGINADKFYTNRLNNTNDTFNIIYVGRVYKSKGLHLLVQAAQILKDCDIKVNIVGKVYYEYGQELIKYVKDNKLEDIVEFTGARTDIPDLLANADLFVHPVICEEGFGITLAEALAAYVPCIAFSRGAIPEIIDSGVNGFIVNETSAQNLANAISTAYKMFNTDEYIQLRKNARKKAEGFSIETVTKELEKLYE
ncbi:MAG: glycosyltransferase family 4 protein [Eubacterium sp.]